MARMGHDSSAAAMIYQHATGDADRAIADALSAAAVREREKVHKAKKAIRRNGTEQRAAAD
jgi:hypothetical protein